MDEFLSTLSSSTLSKLFNGLTEDIRDYRAVDKLIGSDNSGTITELKEAQASISEVLAERGETA